MYLCILTHPQATLFQRTRFCGTNIVFFILKISSFMQNNLIFSNYVQNRDNVEQAVFLDFAEFRS